MAGFDFNTPTSIGFGGGNPFTASLLAQIAGTNPELISSAAASAGISPPNMLNGVDNNASPLGYYMTPSVADPSMMPGAAPAGGADPQKIMQALQGFKGPGPVKPIMDGGVSGSQKAPDANMNAQSAGSQQIAQLLQTLMQAGGPGPAGGPVRQTPNLGALIGG